jgi:hypothetical protein
MKTIIFKKIQRNWNIHKTPFIYQRIDKNHIPKNKIELRLFAIARNESLRLPFFLKYYFEKGVDRIFLVDNDSTDNTREIALSCPNVHVFKINKSFKNFWYWIDFFLNKYGMNKWCLVVDIDELFFYPFAEIASLKILINYMEFKKYEAIRSFLLDIYSDKPISETNYKANENPLECCPYFDPDFYSRQISMLDKKTWKWFETTMYFGGMRERVFNKITGSSWNYHLAKISLFKYKKNIYLTEGMHAINGANMADITGIVFHSKYLQDFIERVKVESKRGVHYGNALEYKIYNKACLIEKNLPLKNQNSIKFQDSKQLVKLGMMKSSIYFNSFLALQDLNFDNYPRKNLK